MSKKTPLHSRHLSLKAQMADFGGYEMPLWYPAGAKKEHLAVLTGAGLFDTSHMALIMVSGGRALDLLQQCLTKDLDHCTGTPAAPLAPGRCAYGAFLDSDGHLIDDAIINRINDETFMVVVNAGMGALIVAHLSREAQDLSPAPSIHDLTDQVGKLDLQGPQSANILASVLDNPGLFSEPFPFFSFKGHFDAASPLAHQVRLNDGTPVLLSRTGYTGEFGFEIYLPFDRLESTWRLVLEAGQEKNCVPCGLAARDSLRAGAMLPLSHQDMGDWPFINHPWEHALPFTGDGHAFSKSFIGDEALLQNRGTGFFTYPFAGFDLRKVQVGPNTVVVDSENRNLGTVLTCVTDVAIDRQGARIFSITSPDRPEGFRPRGLCCGFVRLTEPIKTGAIVEIRDERRSLPVMIMNDLRPDRTARRPVRDMLANYDDPHRRKTDISIQ